MEVATTGPRIGRGQRRRNPNSLPGKFWRKSAPCYVHCLTWGFAPKLPNNAARNIAAPRRLVQLICAGNPIRRPSATRQYQLNLDCDLQMLCSFLLRFTDVCCISELIKPRALGRALKFLLLRTVLSSSPPPGSALKFLLLRVLSHLDRGHVRSLPARDRDGQREPRPGGGEANQTLQGHAG